MITCGLHGRCCERSLNRQSMKSTSRPSAWALCRNERRPSTQKWNSRYHFVWPVCLLNGTCSVPDSSIFVSQADLIRPHTSYFLSSSVFASHSSQQVFHIPFWWQNAVPEGSFDLTHSCFLGAVCHPHNWSTGCLHDAWYHSPGEGGWNCLGQRREKK